MTEDEMQECLALGDLPGTPSEVRAIEHAFALGRRRVIAEILAELDAMHSSLAALDAATDLRHLYAAELQKSER